MAKEMIVSVNGRERKIAVIENGQVVEFYIERGENDQGFVGNIYKGRVQRVLPGMQSAFVNIGLERDAFLYVSDFFDEEEEFERIMIEKGAKKPEAEKEVVEHLQKERLVREHQMEAAHELAEPLVDGEHIDDEKEAIEVETGLEDNKKGKRGGRSRGRSGKKVDDLVESVEAGADRVEAGTMFFIEEDSNFERIVDSEETTGEMFKEAYVQEAIQDKVRAIEFDVESTSSAEVGSLLSSMELGGGFERIADEDEPAFSFDRGSNSEEAKPKKGSRGGAKPKADRPNKTKPAGTKKPAKGKTGDKPKTKKPAKAKSEKAGEASETGENYGDAQASVGEPSNTGEFAMRRGGRGRRRRPVNKKEHEGPTEDRFEGAETDETVNVENELAGAEMTPIKEETEEKEAPAARKPSGNGRPEGRSEGRSEGRTEGRRDGRRGGGRNDRNDRGKGDNRRDRPPQPTISELLREGQEVIVQIAKEPIARKGARITSHIALPGRYIVYMPTIEHVGVSRKIESASERTRLRTVIQKIRTEEDVPSGGFIVRTAGIGILEAQLREDARYLVRTWLEIKKQAEKSKAPALVHQDLDLVQRILRDQLSDDFAAIRVDSEEDYLHIVEFVSRVKPHMVNRVKLYTREDPILETYGVQAEIEKAIKPRVWLRSGGYLVINQTEALVAIDVNTGKFVGKGNARLEDTITKTNMEAVEEIARQIRLRDLGGILVLDLIDMEDRRNRHKVLATLQDALHRDKSPTKVLSYNDFGLIIMTRKRVKQSLERTLCTPCPYCQGSSLVKSPETVCYEILEEARRLSKTMERASQIILRVHPEIANVLRSSEREVLGEIEAYLGNLDLTGDTAVHQEQYDFAFV